ncbi:GGDEF domain-containing protein [Rhodocyclus tenuis]|uniref:GGDEF domain-containing protein n=1 Tax=Rhodocyclus gracilis TaxID=2929842 RepID=A0ABX0WJ83_9RHOO|nr:GGDEF domain-containing protein [Rhodocyclus gracilis]NJA88876.1 GGDEF domain-containing protein [Rhodocyclus gracilis]
MAQTLIRRLPLRKFDLDDSEHGLCTRLENDERDRSAELDTLVAIIRERRLQAVFQPILDFRTHTYFAYEALIRGPQGTPLHAPSALFAAADRHGLRRELEAVCREIQFVAFAERQLPGKLFINASPASLDDDLFRNGSTLQLLRRLDLKPTRIVIELTENQRVSDFPRIQQTLAHFRGLGYQIAIDDLGEGFSNMRMWSEVKPEYVKIDQHFINGIADDTLKFQFVKAMHELAETCSARVIAEGIERDSDCLALRDLGVACGQGYLIERPTPSPSSRLGGPMRDLLRRGSIAVFPRASGAGQAHTVRQLARWIEPVTPDTLNEVVYRRFAEEAELGSLPVVADGTPRGLINRHAMIDRFARPYRRDLYECRPCTQFMDAAPLIFNEDATVQEAGLLISRSARHHLTDGFIITDNGAYLGVGSGHDLMALITEMQIQAARYANPLTQLPGNVPLNEHIDHLLRAGTAFRACYCDIDHFKAFNDTYGYRKGDDIIQILGTLLRENSDPRLDFVGHIGGDDFLALFQSGDWEARCARILRLFDSQIAAMVTPLDLQRGGYLAENHRGEAALHPLPTLSIGALALCAGDAESHQEVASAASETRRHAKKISGSSLFIARCHSGKSNA